MACDTWHMTCDLWHVTCDMWLGVNILLKCQLPRSYGLEETFKFEDFFIKDQWASLVSYLIIYYKGVCRTAPATPALLKTLIVS